MMKLKTTEPKVRILRTVGTGFCDYMFKFCAPNPTIIMIAASVRVHDDFSYTRRTLYPMNDNKTRQSREDNANCETKTAAVYRR